MQTAASTQIGTQSCLMDTEDSSQVFLETQEQQQLSTQHQIKSAQQQQEQQQQVDVAMSATSQQTTNSAPSNAYNSSLQQQQVHFQGHLHRTNRDVSRCMLSHMI